MIYEKANKEKTEILKDIDLVSIIAKLAFLLYS
jgi:hypothetical protein